MDRARQRRLVAKAKAGASMCGETNHARGNLFLCSSRRDAVRIAQPFKVGFALTQDVPSPEGTADISPTTCSTAVVIGLPSLVLRTQDTSAVTGEGRDSAVP